MGPDRRSAPGGRGSGGYGPQRVPGALDLGPANNGIPWRTVVPALLIVGALVGFGASTAGCGTTDKASDETLPPMVTTTSTTLPATTTIDPNVREFYVVKRGDTLASIAEAFEVTVNSIIDLNGITDPDNIAAGLTLEIPNGIRVIDELPAAETTTTSEPA